MVVSLAYSFVNAKTLKDYIRSILENNASQTMSERASGVTSLSSLVFKRSGGERCVCVCVDMNIQSGAILNANPNPLL